MKAKLGLILMGGGARAAYQVGVLKAIAEMLPEGAPPVPFRIICGTSAGAINAAGLACDAVDFRRSMAQLESFWVNIRTDHVFRTEASLAVTSGLRWFLSLLFGGLGPLTPRSILDNRPLRALLESQLQLGRVQGWIDTGVIDAFSVTTAAYRSGQSVTFYQGRDSIRPWNRTRRIGVPRPITLDQLMASSAIPILFPAVRIGYDYYGDGSMRQLTPVSAALHLGADRLLVIGTRNDDKNDFPEGRLSHPSVGEIWGYILDMVFMDSLSMDIERLKRINHTLQQIPATNREKIALRPVELLTIFPSQDIRPITERHRKAFPRSVRYLLRCLGALNQGGRPLMSYLLFEGDFCRELIALGYGDGMAVRDRLAELIDPKPGSSARHVDPGICFT